MGEITKIEINNLTFGYGHKKKVLEDFTMSIKPGQITGLVGRNGQGKTTLMKLLAGKIEPDSGKIEITIDSEKMNPSKDIEAANEIIYSSDTVFYGERLKLKDILKKYEVMYRQFDMSFAIKMLNIFNVDTNKRIRNISKGQESMFNFACAMATRAGITILDEPVAGVDAISRNKVYDIILRDYIEHPRTIIISSHMLGEMEKLLSGIVMIGNKKILFSGNIEEIKDRAFRVMGSEEDVSQFIKGRKVLCRQNNVTDSMAIVEDVNSGDVENQAAKLNLKVSSLTAEEYYIATTGNNNGEELEQLWEEQN